MSGGRLNFKATIDDKDFNNKLDSMKKGVEALSKSINSANTSLGTGNTFNSVTNNITNLNNTTNTLNNTTNTLNQTLNRTSNTLNNTTNNLTQNNNTLNQLNNTTNNLNNNLNQTSNASNRANRGLRGVFSTVATYFGAFAGIQSVIGLITGAFRTIVDFDSKLLNVSKTTGLAGQELKDLGVALRGLSEELKVVSVNKLTEYATVAGQLGVKGTSDILAFTEALAKLEITSNISGKEGGSQIARFLTLTDGSVKNVANFGDEVTKLGNNFAATESEIVKNSLAIAQNTGVYKLGRQEALAYGTATKAVGVEAELTGSTIGRTFAQIDKSLRTGKGLQELSTITGRSIEDLKQAFKTDPSGVLYSFVEGLNAINKSGGSVNNALSKIGITAVRDQRVLGSLASNGFDVLTRALEDAGSASGAMQKEFDTASGKIKNSIEGVKVSWENFILAINGSENAIGGFVSKWMKGLSIMIDGVTQLTTGWRELQRIQGNKVQQTAFTEIRDFYKSYNNDKGTRESASAYFKLLKNEEKELIKSINDRENALKKANDATSGEYWKLRKGSDTREGIIGDISKLRNDLDMVQGTMKGINSLADDYNSSKAKTNEINADIIDLETTLTKNNKTLNDLTQKRADFIDSLNKAENDLTQSTLRGLDLEKAKIEEVYQERLKKAKELKANQEAFNKIESLKTKETDIVTYKRDTENIKTALESDKVLYEQFEEYKKQVGIQKAKEMYADQLDVSKSYYDVLNDEISKIDLNSATDLEKDRYNVLFKLLQDYSINRINKEKETLENLIIENQSYQDRLILIQETYAQKRKDLEKITDESIRNEELAILKQREQDATLIIENEIYERNKVERDLIRSLTNYTKRELQSRLRSTQEYLNLYGEFLSDNQKLALQSEADFLKSVIGATDQISRQNTLLKEKERITKAIKENTSKDPEIAKKLNNELADVNNELESNDSLIKDTNHGIQLAVQMANMLTDAFGGTNKELKMAVESIGNIVSAIAKGDMAGAVMAVVGTMIQGAISIFGKDREGERRRDQEKLQLQEEYNKMLRDQLLLESRLNDAHQSRIQAIREEIEMLGGNQESVLNRMKDILNTFYEFYKDFGGRGSSLDFDFYAGWQYFGLNEYFENGVELSDELLNKLILLNSEAPLKGTMKDLFDELMRLKEEFGSVNEAVKQLEKELQDRLTGTTAQALGDSIRDGIASGKRSFQDFADDIEGFLRNAILAGMSASVIEPQMQQLQDLLGTFMEDGILTKEERQAFEDKYAQIVEQAGQYLDLINQAGVNIGDDLDMQSAKDGIKRITESQADRLTGILTGMQVDVIASRQILMDSRNLLNSSLDNLIMIEVNTRRTYEGVERIETILQNNQQQSLGL